MVKVIIWVDDDRDLLRPQGHSLVEDGYDVSVIPDVDDAIETIKRRRDAIHGLILDVMMNPGITLRAEGHQGGLITGLVLFQYLRDKALCPPVKAFVYTHRFDPDAAEKLAALGVSYYQKQHFKGKAICELVRKEFG